jgi:hypothetical protein
MDARSRPRTCRLHTKVSAEEGEIRLKRRPQPRGSPLAPGCLAARLNASRPAPSI